MLLIRKIRRAMKELDSPPLKGAVEADETSVRHCVQDSGDPVGGRSPVGKPMIAGATG